MNKLSIPSIPVFCLLFFAGSEFWQSRIILSILNPGCGASGGSPCGVESPCRVKNAPCHLMAHADENGVGLHAGVDVVEPVGALHLSLVLFLDGLYHPESSQRLTGRL